MQPFFLEPGTKTGLNIQYRNPVEVGADRIANAIAATHLYVGKNLVIVDLGTATTFCAVSAKKEYSKQENTSNVVVECPYFNTKFLALNGGINVKNNGDSFIVYMCTEGQFSVSYQEKTHSFAKGDTILLPAIISDYQIVGQAALLEITI